MQVYIQGGKTFDFAGSRNSIYNIYVNLLVLGRIALLLRFMTNTSNVLASRGWSQLFSDMINLAWPRELAGRDPRGVHLHPPLIAAPPKV